MYQHSAQYWRPGQLLGLVQASGSRCCWCFDTGCRDTRYWTSSFYLIYPGKGGEA